MYVGYFIFLYTYIFISFFKAIYYFIAYFC